MDPIKRKNDQFEQSLAAAGAPTENPMVLDPAIPAGLAADTAKALVKIPVELRRVIYGAGQEMGEFSGLNLGRQVITMAMLAKLHDIKKSKSYRASGIVNWESFCEQMLHCNHDVIDEQIAFLRKFGPDFLAAAKQISLSRRVLRELKALPESEVREIVHGNAIRIDGEEIPLDEDHADEVNEALESAIAKYRAEAQAAAKKADVAAKKLLEREVQIEAAGREIEKLKAQVEELHGGPRLEGIERRALELYQRIRTDLEQLTALFRELQDEPTRRLVGRMYVEELERKVTDLSQAVTLEYDLPDHLLHAGPDGGGN